MADQPNPKAPVEVIPSFEDTVSAIGSAHAPFLFFDHAPTFGYSAGIVSVTLEARRFHHLGDGKIGVDRVTVAHLRMSVPAALALRKAIDGALLLAQPTQSEVKN